jgi:uncharacterized protein (TIGR01777 family)
VSSGATRTIVVSGATGLIGRRLVASLGAGGPRLVALTRDPERAAPALDPRHRAVAWDGLRVPATALDGADAVLHLAGEPLFGGLPTPGRLARIRASRVDSTRAIVATLQSLPAGRRPAVLACASAVGIYGSRGEEELGEDAPPGSGFLAELCREWETAAIAATAYGVRVVCLRFGIVLAREGGALALMARIFRLGLGGRLGSGRQWVPWVHADDAVALVRRALDDAGVRGALNVAAPGCVRNAELTRELAARLRRPALLPAPGFAVRAALGPLAGELLGSRRVVPRRALELGYAFAQPTLAGALAREIG